MGQGRVGGGVCSSMEPLRGLVLMAGLGEDRRAPAWGLDLVLWASKTKATGWLERGGGDTGFCFLVPGVGGEDVVGRGSLQGTTLLLSRRKCHLQ